MDEKKDNLIVDLTFQFALGVIKYCDSLKEKKKYEMSSQLFKSGTSIGANVREAQGAESRADFIHKMKIAYKEAEETEYWLNLCKLSDGYADPGFLTDKIQSIIKILGKIISSSKK